MLRDAPVRGRRENLVSVMASSSGCEESMVVVGSDEEAPPEAIAAGSGVDRDHRASFLPG